TGPGLTNTPNVTVALLTPGADSGNITPIAQLAYSLTETNVGGATTLFASPFNGAFTLTPGDGVKTLTARIQDLAGNVSAASAPASVPLDTTPPSGGTIAAPGLTPATRVVPGGVNLSSVTSDLNGPVRYALSEDAVNPPADAAFGTAAQFGFPRPFTLGA